MLKKVTYGDTLSRLDTIPESDGRTDDDVELLTYRVQRKGGTAVRRKPTLCHATLIPRR